MTRLTVARVVRALPALLLALLLVPAAARAQDGENRVGLVVDRGDGDVTTACVAFDEPELTGLEVLQRSGLAVDVDQQSGGAAVCRIDETGCSAGNCFCACTGGECVYWSYWQLIDGEWRYAIAGASRVRVTSGAVEGWTWGPGSVTEAAPPPQVTFEEICAAAPDPPPSDASSVPALATTSLAPVASATVTSAPLPSATIPSDPAASTSTTGNYFWLLVIAGVLAGVAAAAASRTSKRRQRDGGDG